MRIRTSLLLALGCLIVCSAELHAQTTVRWYLAPTAGSGASPADTITSKARVLIDRADAASQVILIGNWSLAGMRVTAAQHATIAADPEVTAIPANLSNNVGGALNATQNRLEAMNLPAGWVTSGTTWRQVLSRVIRMLHLRRQVRTLFSDGVTLDSTFNSLPAGKRAALVAAADRLNIDRSDLTGASTLREILAALGGRGPALTLLGEVF